MPDDSSVEFKITANVPSVMRHLRETAIERVGLAAVYMQGKIREELTGPRSGRMYRVPGTRTNYQASAPGEPPAARTGAAGLLGSIHIDHSDPLDAIIGSRKFNPDYPHILEFYKNRPFVGPTFSREADAVRQIILDGWE